MRRTILVTDGEQRSALAIVRSLGRAGHRVLVCSRDSRSLAGASRSCHADERAPDPLSDEHGYVERLVEICGRHGVDALIPATDAASVAILPARGRFAGCRVLAPSHESFVSLSDKVAVAEAAARAGLVVPKAVVVRSLEALSEGDWPHDFPVVIKPARSVSGAAGARVRTSVRYANDRRTLREALGTLPSAAFPVLIQKKIRGIGVGVFLLRWDSRTLGAFSHRRIREKPPEGGVSVYRESVPLDPALLAACEHLLVAHALEGVAMVEFKRCTSSGADYLMEVNARFWGSLQLAIDAGVDFPALFVQAAHGPAPRPVVEYRLGVRSRWFWGDVDHTIAVMRAPGLRSRFRTLIRFLGPPGPKDRCEVLRLRDPRPFLRETKLWWGSLFRSLRRRRIGTPVASAARASWESAVIAERKGVGPE